LVIFFSVWLTSCFEVNEKLYVGAKGNGSYSIRLDFNASRAMLTSIQNDLQKYQQPYENLPLEKITQAFRKKAFAIQQIDGISNVRYEQDGYAWELSFDFSHPKALNCAIAELETGMRNSCWQTYYVIEKKSLQKKNIFYLHSLFENIHQYTFEDNASLQRTLNDIIAQAHYTISITTEKRIKKIDHPEFQKISPTTLQLTRKINALHEPTLRWDVKVSLKR
ncbi:MAG: hypothetical protein RMJ89_07085, partial [Flammeovirgaceae bacterium]|nr:hypothetical protein [Flammeovirgaceae bacterium]